MYDPRWRRFLLYMCLFCGHWYRFFFFLTATGTGAFCAAGAFSDTGAFCAEFAGAGSSFTAHTVAGPAGAFCIDFASDVVLGFTLTTALLSNFTCSWIWAPEPPVSTVPTRSSGFLAFFFVSGLAGDVELLPIDLAARSGSSSPGHTRIASPSGMFLCLRQMHVSRRVFVSRHRQFLMSSPS